MPTDHNTPESPDTAPDTAVHALKPNPLPRHTDATAGASQPHDEATMREWQGLPPDAVILAPAFAAAPPMRLPEHVWAMLVLAVDIIDTDPDCAGEVALFAGSWVPDQPPADRLYDGDLVVRLMPPADPTFPPPGDHAVDVEMLLAYHGRWQRVGQWCRLDDRWPGIVAPTAAAVMGLHTDAVGMLAQTVAPLSPPAPQLRWTRGGIRYLVDAGLLKPGDELVWNRRNNGVRHTACVNIDGTLVLADGRAYANPSGATTALGGNHQNGWNAFRRTSDGRTLGELRNQLRTRRGH